MKLNEILNSKGNPKLWSRLPCEICDAPTRWVLSPYCHKCEWLVAYWRGGVVDHEHCFGDLPPPEALNGDSVLLSDEMLPWFNSRGLYVDPLDRTRLISWGTYENRLKPAVAAAPHWSEAQVDRFRWNEQNQLERVSKLERSIDDKSD